MKTILLTIIILGIIILIHECGHFLTARLFKVKVNEFSIGMGPAIYSKEKNNIKYSIRMIPIGGYVAMEGEDEDPYSKQEKCLNPISDNKETDIPFYQLKAWKRFIVIAAGAIMNLLLGFFILYGITLNQGIIGTNQIASTQIENPTELQLNQGDIVRKINGYRINSYNDAIFQILRDTDGTLDFVVERNNKLVSFSSSFEFDEEIKSINIDFLFNAIKSNPFNSIPYSFNWACSIVKQVIYSVVDLITGNVGIDAVSGPVGTAEIISEASSMGMSSLLLLVSYLTINIGVFNLFPIPALDGGRLFFIIFELIFRHAIPSKFESWIHRIGIILLFGLFILITWNDIIRIVTGR